MIVRITGHVDTFAQERLPPPEQLPELLFDTLGLRYPERINAAELLDGRVAAGSAGDPCIVLPGAGAWTYADLQRAANRIARVLVEDLEVVPGNRVLLRAPNSPMLAACWFAVLKAGGIAVTSMPLYRERELRFVMEKAQVKHGLCDAGLRDEFERACVDCRGLQVAYFNDPRGSAESLEERMRSKAAIFVMSTPRRKTWRSSRLRRERPGPPRRPCTITASLSQPATRMPPGCCGRSDDLFCGSPPLAFTFGLGGLLLFPLYAGAATLLLEKAGPAELLAAIANFGVTTLFSAPIAYRAMAGSIDAL